MIATPIACVLDFGELVAGDEDGAPLRRELPEKQTDLADAGRVETVRRLVEEQQRRVLEQCRGETESLAHSQGVVLHRMVGALAQPDEFEAFHDASLADPVDRAEQPQVSRPVIVGNIAGVSTMAPMFRMTDPRPLGVG